MARAKHTVRADARRRSRQVAVDDPMIEGDAETSPATGPATGPTARSAGGGRSGAPVARPSITAAFRLAYHPANIREDLALLPRLIRSKAFLVGLGLIAAGSVAIVIDPASPISIFAFQTLVLPPAMAPIFVVGFFAPRASYLLGGILGFIDFAVYAGFVATLLPTLGTPDPSTVQDQVLAALAVGPAGGILFASAAAWYRRFLNLSNASARRAREARQGQAKGRPAPKRR